MRLSFNDRFTPYLIYLVGFTFALTPTYGQDIILNNGIAISNDGSNPQEGHILDIQSQDKGILIPRVDLVNPDFLKAPVDGAVESTLVYNIGTSSDKGFYYWDGTKWQRLVAQEDVSPIPSGLIMLSDYQGNYPGYDYAGRVGFSSNTEVLGYGTGKWTETEHISTRRSYKPTCVAIGDLIISWSGEDNAYFEYENDGGVYNLTNNSWTLMSTVNAPIGRFGNGTAVDSTFAYMAIWGGAIAGTSGGVQYEVTDTGGESRYNHTGVGTGGFKYIFWGGSDGNGNYFNDGASYNSNWTLLPPSPLSARSEHTTIFADGKMYVFGGRNATTAFSDGAIFDTQTNTWSMMPDLGSTEGRYWHAMVYTGSDIIVFGGRKSPNSSSYHRTGYKYNIQSNVWSPISLYPNAQFSALAVGAMAYGWLNGEMIIAGGINSFGIQEIVTAYNPETDSWRYVNSLPRQKAFAGFTVTDSNKFVIANGTYGPSPGSTDVYILDPTDPLTNEIEFQVSKSFSKYRKQ